MTFPRLLASSRVSRRHTRRSRLIGTAIGFVCLSALGCSTDPEQPQGIPSDPLALMPSGEDGVSVGPATRPNNGNLESLVIAEPEPIAEPDFNASTGFLDPCELAECGMYARCESADDWSSHECISNTCADLSCTAAEVCEETAEGAYCRDLTCETDVECVAGEYCGESGTCAAQACEPNARHCDGNTLIACDERGAAEGEFFTCGSSSSYFESTCVAGATATCSCEDDWDCPPNTICELGLCEGTGVAATCSLPPAEFSAEDTTLEISWGGTSNTSREAVGSPYPDSAQTQITPLVANLDDDNGDGIIDEQDVPEIIFVTFDNSGGNLAFTSNGILRAIHGGPLVRTENGQQVVVKERGGDFFAVCDGENNKRWLEGTGYAGEEDCGRNDPVINATAPIAVGDLNYDGVPEIVALSEYAGGETQVLVYSNKGEFIARGPGFDARVTSDPQVGLGQDNAAITLANLDAAGNAEIIVGRWVFQLEDGEMLHFGAYFEGDGTNGSNEQGPVACVGNIIDDGDGAVQEVIAGSTVYTMPLPAAGETDQATCTGTHWCDQKLIRRWKASNNEDGFCAIADVLGADQSAPPGPDNPLDGVPEVILQGNAALFIYNGQLGTLIETLTTVANTADGGPPNVDDFDGDGFPEIGTAAQNGYAVFDLQAAGDSCPAWPDFADRRNPDRAPPDMACQTHADCGDTTQFACNMRAQRCVCQHNSWVQPTQDASSRVTGSSVFDFNGDGAAEVVYNDECNFRVYDGLTGDVLMEEWGEARTRIEYPVVADVDRDGNAEIVFSTTNESGFCRANPDRDLFNNGIEVWGDQRDLWVPARAIWNQHAYHVTNITESGVIPVEEPESWKEHAGRRYNTYRSNPRTYGVAPDLVVRGVQVTSPDAACGSLGTVLDIVMDIGNEGDLLVGAEVQVAIYGTWDGATFEPLLDAAGVPIQMPLGSALPAKRNLLLTFNGYSPANNGKDTLPLQLRVVADATEIETECVEDNNERIADVTDGDNLPDLTIEFVLEELTCPNPVVTVILGNNGSAPASNIEIAFFAGDPNQGGELVHTEVFAGPLEPRTTQELQVQVPIARTSTLYAVVDYSQLIEECNDGNNGAQGPDLLCLVNEPK